MPRGGDGRPPRRSLPACRLEPDGSRASGLERPGGLMVPGARLVILGKQGAGKGTQCVRLARHYVVPHISTGEMFRAAVRAGTEFGRKAKSYMGEGELIPDDVVVGVIRERLDQDDTAHRGFILDGFARTTVQ